MSSTVKKNIQLFKKTMHFRQKIKSLCVYLILGLTQTVYAETRIKNVAEKAPTRVGLSSVTPQSLMIKRQGAL